MATSTPAPGRRRAPTRTAGTCGARSKKRRRRSRVRRPGRRNEEDPRMDANEHELREDVISFVSIRVHWRVVLLLLLTFGGLAGRAEEAPPWVAPMREVHAKFM